MVVDFHTHVFPKRVVERRDEFVKRDPLFSSLYSNPKSKMATSEELLRSMEENGVDFSVILGGSYEDPELLRLINEYILESSSKHKNLIPFCCAKLDEAREISRLADEGARGIGEIRLSGDILDEGILREIDEIAVEKGLILLFHSSEPVGHMYPGKGDIFPQVIWRILELIPRAKKVFAHWGGGIFFYSLMPEVEEALKNAFFDTAATPFLYRDKIFKVAMDIVGSEKILFGTDFPLISQRRMLELIRALDIGEDYKGKILGENGRRLLEDKDIHSR